MSNDPNRYGSDNWALRYADEVAVTAGVGASIRDVEAGIVKGNIGIQSHFSGTDEQRIEGKDKSYEEADKQSGEFDI